MKINASLIRFALIGSIILAIAFFSTAVWWLNDRLREFNLNANHAKIDAELSQQDAGNLLLLRSTLDNRKDVVQLASELVASPERSKYQDQIISDIKNYASRHNLKVSTVTFILATNKAKAPTGTTLIPFTLSLSGVVPYNKFLNFLRDMEDNIPKVRVTSLNISPDSKNPSSITAPTFNMEIYVKA